MYEKRSVAVGVINSGIPFLSWKKVLYKIAPDKKYGAAAVCLSNPLIQLVHLRILQTSYRRKQNFLN